LEPTATPGSAGADDDEDDDGADVDVAGGVDDFVWPELLSQAATAVTTLRNTTIADTAVRQTLWKRFADDRADVAKEPP
jgi:hypothetical protein